MTTRFERETAVWRRDDETFAARLDPSWWVQRGPNGGYLAAIMLRALMETVADATRSPRSLTIHYAAPPEAGEVAITTTIERVGGLLTSCSARMHQGDRLIALGLGAFSGPRAGPTFCDLPLPDVAAPDEIEASELPAEAPPIAHRWETRWVAGSPPVPDRAITDEALSGGWIRLPELHVIDALVIAAAVDGWVPAVFSRTDEQLIVPTVDLTVHFRVSLPLPGAQPDDFVLALFRTKAATDGFLEEDGVVWAADGTLIAQSRQLAVAFPLVSG